MPMRIYLARPLRFLWRRLRRAVARSCRALAAPLPGVNYILALTAITARRRKEMPPAPGCIHCGASARECDAGQTHWILRAAVIGADSDRRRAPWA